MFSPSCILSQVNPNLALTMEMIADNLCNLRHATIFGNLTNHVVNLQPET